MSTVPATVQRGSWLRPKYLLFAFIGLMVVYVLRHNESFLLDRQDPVWNHYQPFKWWLLPHGLAGACALLLGPMQFSDRLRQRYAKLHRVVGRIYVAGALIVAPLGAYIQYFEERMNQPRSFTMAAVADAALLMITTSDRLCIYPSRQCSATPRLDDPQLRRGVGLRRSASHWRGYRLGEPRRRCQRNHRLDVRRLLAACGRHCSTVAGAETASSRSQANGAGCCCSALSWLLPTGSGAV